MKKHMIAFMLSLIIVAASIGGSSLSKIWNFSFLGVTIAKIWISCFLGVACAPKIARACSCPSCYFFITAGCDKLLAKG